MWMCSHLSQTLREQSMDDGVEDIAWFSKGEVHSVHRGGKVGVGLIMEWMAVGGEHAPADQSSMMEVVDVASKAHHRRPGGWPTMERVLNRVESFRGSATIIVLEVWVSGRVPNRNLGVGGTEHWSRVVVDEVEGGPY